MNLREQLERWLTSRAPGERWRRGARSAIGRTVESYLNTHHDVDAKELMRLVDDAYPFGARQYHPYKMWLAERRAFADLLFPRPEPTVDELSACDVAADLVELGRPDEAEALLREQAPNRLNRKCPVCNAGRGRRCSETDGSGPRLIPHRLRVQPALSFGSP